MKDGFRQSQAWWHTWTGLVCGWLLFAIFFTGTTAVFIEEGQFWLTPEVHRAAVATSERNMVDTADQTLRNKAPEGSARWFIALPTERGAQLRVGWFQGGRQIINSLDPLTGEVLHVQPRASRAFGMLYGFHFSLLQGQLGIWIVGLITMVMLVLLVSGVIVHKRIFKDFFTFRPGKAPGRSWLDAHNVSSVMVLPFSLMITYSGLVIWWNIWMPAGVMVAYGDVAALRNDVQPRLEIARNRGNPAVTLPLSSFVASAQARMPEGRSLRTIQVFWPGGTRTQVAVRHSRDALLWGGNDTQIFDGATGELLHRPLDEGGTADVTQKVFLALHKIHFAGPVLRWLYFLMSAGSCVMIATGLVLWTVKRREKALKFAMKHGGRLDAAHMRGWRLAEALNVGTVAGILSGTAAMFWSNRLIPAHLPGRDALEIRVFFSVWLLCGVWALIRAWRLTVVVDTSAPQSRWAIAPRRLWAEQLRLAALLYLLLPVINAVMTPNSALWVTIPTDQWIVAGFDLTMLGSGALLALIAKQVGRSRASPSRRAIVQQVAEERVA